MILPVPSAAGNRRRRTVTRYREAYESLQAALPLIKPGPCPEFFSPLRWSTVRRNFQVSMVFTAWVVYL